MQTITKTIKKIEKITNALRKTQFLGLLKHLKK
jgi:hypothetical protein